MLESRVDFEGPLGVVALLHSPDLLDGVGAVECRALGWELRVPSIPRVCRERLFVTLIPRCSAVDRWGGRDAPRTVLMFGPQPFKPIRGRLREPRTAPRLNSARCSVLWVSPLRRQSERLKLEASAAGLGNVVAHRPSCRQTLDTPVFVSVHHV